MVFSKNKLIGKWKISDNEAIKQFGDTEIEFKKNGDLIYKIISKEKEEIILLKYQIKNNFIITNQPTKPKIEETEYEIYSNDKLILNYNNVKVSYKRIV